MLETNEKLETLQKNISFLKEVVKGLMEKGNSYLNDTVILALEKLGIEVKEKNVNMGSVPIEEEKSSSLRAT